jgi:alpha-mannosidase
MYHRARWTPKKIGQLLELITPLAYIRKKSLPSFRFHELESALTTPPIDAAVDDSAWQEINPHEYWGLWLQNFILRTTFTVPDDWDKAQPIALYLPLGEAGDFSHPEALAYIDSGPYAACDRHHQEILLKPEWADGKSHLLALHGWTGMGNVWKDNPYTRLYMRRCEVVQIHAPTRDLVALARIALETAQAVDEDNPVRHELLTALNEAFIALDTRDPPGSEAFYQSVAPAMQVLKAGIDKSGAPLEAVVHATGHAHIDIAWLWTLGQTRRKAERTFQNAIRLMEQFPEYHFTQSQPQLYQFIKEDQPALFESIRQRIAEGRWEPIGGMWVEADCNLSGAESLARQFLLGRTFFREHFGEDAESPILWLPDVFGYAWALPQLIRQAGLKYFMTIKIGWSQYNRLPYDTFLWQGIDGTQILTHFSTVPDPGGYGTSTYNAMANAREALGTWKNFQQKELHKDLLMAYGFGDGGGGPTLEMLENIEVMKRFPGLPQVKQSSAKAFFESIAPLSDSKMMPVWNGELYLELHRGTYTSQAHNKRANRKSEFLLHDAEFLATYASLITNYQYPLTELQNAWRTLCLNQFHDIIPGSSIGAVYEESQQQYAEVKKNITQIRDEALEALAQKLDGDILLVNATSFAQSGLVFIPGDASQEFRRDGKLLPAQEANSGVWVDAGEIGPYSICPLSLRTRAGGEGESLSSLTPGPSSSGRGELLLENDFLRVEFNPAGDITRIFHKKAKREVLAPNTLANQFQAFEDRPSSWDAWDIEIYYDDKMWLAEPASVIKMIEYGALCQTIEIKRQILNSRYTQRISLVHNSPRLDFDTHVEWNERHTLLKVAFPVDVLAPYATYEIQWGNVQRPTHRNTSWDWSRFETCAHKWVDLSEGNYGVSLLNDCKYGHDIRDNVIRLTLLRSPTMPDPTADVGEHQFKYTLYPHAGGVIVRLYESQRKRGPLQLRAAFGVAAAWETNLLEENESELSVKEDTIQLDLKPYQIMTLRLKLK